MTREIRVLHVINGLGTGGAERSLAEMLPLLDDLGIRSEIACLSVKPEGVHGQLEGEGRPIHVVGTQPVTAARRIRHYVRSGTDVVHTTIFEADVIGRLAAAGLPARVLTSLVNTTYDGVRRADSAIPAWKFAAVKQADAVTARRLTDRFHALTGAVKQSAVEHLGISPDRVAVIERGRSRARLGEPSAARRAAARLRLGLDEHAEVVLSVGRQEPQKDQATLLRAAAEIAPARPGLVVLQAGREGKSSAVLRSLAADPRLAGRVRFLGHRDDVGELLAAADVFAFPSVYEGLGGSVIEAMAMEVPIVVSDAPALVEVVDDGRAADVVPVGDHRALASALERLLADRARASQLASRASEVFLDRFTLERSAERMATLYRELVT
jgi:glycosyltransferase involved in cell wall biosynthesis